MDNTEIKVEIVTGTNKETKKDWKAIKVFIGDWTQLIFPRTKFEMDYIEKVLAEQE